MHGLQTAIYSHSIGSFIDHTAIIYQTSPRPEIDRFSKSLCIIDSLENLQAFERQNLGLLGGLRILFKSYAV